MAATVTSSFTSIKSLKADSFNQTKLPSYTLCMQLGTKDLQVCAISNQTNSCVYLESFRLNNIKTVKTRLHAVMELVQSHPLLSSREWDKIKFSYKSHKFTLVPAPYFLADASSDYLALNCEIKSKVEDVYYYKHISSRAVNVFTTDRLINTWLLKQYDQKSVQIIHQGSAFLEAIVRYDDHSHELTCFGLFDRGVMHLAVCKKEQVVYYNQFGVKDNADYLKYIMLTFKELGMSPKTAKLIVWGQMNTNSSQMDFLKKYIRNISYGLKPSYLKFPEVFDDVPDHQYFDLFGIFLCE